MNKISNNQICFQYRNYVTMQERAMGRERAQLTAIRMLAETYSKENHMPFEKAVEQVKNIVDYRVSSDSDYGSFQ